MAVSITASVGANGKNNTTDVIAVQNLLNKWLDTKITVSGTCTGKPDDPTVKAIKTFQGMFTGNPDGRVDAGGKTLNKLNAEPFVLLTQASGHGYYSYGSGNWNERQWGTPETIQTLKDVAQQFQWNNPSLAIGVGDISFRFGGKMGPHGTHREGKNVDIRPLRKDGKPLPVTCTDPDYDRIATQVLVELFLSHKNVKNILFNDPVIHALPRVSPWAGHDNHFHITMID